MGTLQHEVALDTFNRQFKLAMRETRASFIETWCDFWRHRYRASEWQKKEKCNKQELQEHINLNEEWLAQCRLENDQFLKVNESYLAAVKKYAEIDFDVSPLFRQASWTQLWVDSKAHSLYFRYMFHRLRMFLTFHAFIFIGPILLMGVGYSIVSKSIINLLATYLEAMPWVALIFILPYILKRYFFDKKLKKMQMRLEVRLIRPLNLRIFFARILSLQIRTNRLTFE